MPGYTKKRFSLLLTVPLVAFSLCLVAAPSAQAAPSVSDNEAVSRDKDKKPDTYSLSTTEGKYICGGAPDEIHTSINFGCQEKGNAIMDLSFAIIRFLSTGAGLIIIGSLVWAGIQYIISRGDPQSTAAAVNRIQNVMIALLLFIFAYAILNFLIPGAVLK